MSATNTFAVVENSKFPTLESPKYRVYCHGADSLYPSRAPFTVLVFQRKMTIKAWTIKEDICEYTSPEEIKAMKDYHCHTHNVLSKKTKQGTITRTIDSLQKFTDYGFITETNVEESGEGIKRTIKITREEYDHRPHEDVFHKVVHDGESVSTQESLFNGWNVRVIEGSTTGRTSVSVISRNKWYAEYARDYLPLSCSPEGFETVENKSSRVYYEKKVFLANEEYNYLKDIISKLKEKFPSIYFDDKRVESTFVHCENFNPKTMWDYLCELLEAK